MNNNTSTNVPGGNQGEPPTNTPPNVGTSGLNVNQSLSLEELQQQLELERAKNARYEDEAFKAREKERQRKQKEQEEKTALEQKLKEQGEFKQLYEQQQQSVQEHQERIRQLEPVSQRYHDLSLLVAGQIEATVKDWPPEVKAFDPGNDAPVEERLAWIEKSRPLVDKLLQQSRLPGNSPNPKPGSPTAEDQRNEFMRKLRQSGKYGG